MFEVDRFAPNAFALMNEEGGGGGGGGPEVADPGTQASPEANQQPQPAQPQQSLQDMLPEDLRDDPALKDFVDVAGLAKSFKYTQQMVGADKSTILKLPGEASPPEEWNAVYEKLGRPETPDKYEIDPSVWETEDGGELVGVMRDENMEKEFLEKAHELGLNNRQVKELYNWQAEAMKQRSQENRQSAEQMVQAADEVLRKEWGRAYDEKLASAHRAVNELADDKLVDLLEKTGLGNHPTMVKLFAQLGEYMGEDTTRGENGSRSGTLTPKSALAEIEKLQADSNFMSQYMTKDAPGHRQAVEKMEQLFQLAYPSEERRD